MKQHLKSVIWHRHDKKGIHRYVVVGMLVTNKPLKLKNQNQRVLVFNGYWS